MIENLSISDLNAILSRLRDENTKLWYNINSAGEIQQDAQETVQANEKLIAEIEAEISGRVKKLKGENR